MENRVSTLEKIASEQSKQLAELKADMETVKESVLDMREIKEMLLELKKKKKKEKSHSDEGENYVNKNGNNKKNSKAEDEESSVIARTEEGPFFEACFETEAMKSVEIITRGRQGAPPSNPSETQLSQVPTNLFRPSEPPNAVRGAKPPLPVASMEKRRQMQMALDEPPPLSDPPDTSVLVATFLLPVSLPKLPDLDVSGDTSPGLGQRREKQVVWVEPPPPPEPPATDRVAFGTGLLLKEAPWLWVFEAYIFWTCRHRHRSQEVHLLDMPPQPPEPSMPTDSTRGAVSVEAPRTQRKGS